MSLLFSPPGYILRISQATPINTWVKILCAVLTESTERAVVERFMAYVSKYVFQTLLCVYIYIHIHTVISHTHIHEYAGEYAWRSEADIRCLPLYLLIKCTYIHTYRVFMEARGCYQIPSFIMYLLYIKYTHIHTRICNESSHGSQRLISDVSHYCCPYYFLRQTRCLKTDSLADQRVSGTFLPLLPLF